MQTKRLGLLPVLTLLALLTKPALPGATETAETKAADAEAARSAVALEALSRLENVDLNQNPKLKETVLKLLDKTRGTPAFLKLVRQFKLAGQESGLMELALSGPSSDTGVEAMRLILASGDRSLLLSTLGGTNIPAAVKATEALGHTGDQQAVPLLLPLLDDATAEAALQRQAVRSLARTGEGARALLALAREEKLAEDLKYAASSALSAARWPEIRAEAEQLLPLSGPQNAKPLPPLSELLKRNGDPVRGAAVFSSQTAACASCHVVNGRGVDLGPNLSEVGSKLAKEALYEAILDPSAGISFGYEAWQIDLKSGDEAYGLIVSDTADELAIKTAQGIVSRYPSSAIASRRLSRVSVMPTGLQQAMSAEELVDLVEFLGSLKKPANQP